jgi:hypothetical protein
LNPPVRYATEDELARIAPKLEKDTKWLLLKNGWKL